MQKFQGYISILNGNPLQYSCLENPMDGEGYSPWGLKESDTTEWLHYVFHKI